MIRDTGTFVGWYYALWSLHVSKFRKYLYRGKSSGAEMGITFASEVRDGFRKTGTFVGF